MNLLLLTGAFPPDLRREIEKNSKHNIQYAADTLQWNFIKGLKANCGDSIRIINAPIVGSFPLYYKRTHIRKSWLTNDKNSADKSVGFCNLAIIKNYYIKHALLREMEQWVHQFNEGKRMIIVYGMLASFVLAALKIKKAYPNIKLCLIVPDLPEFMGDSQNIFFKIRNFLQPDLYRYIPMFDSFVFLTDEMAEHFKEKGKPWVRIEGMINPDEKINQIGEKTSSPKIVMYSGTLAERYGILDLVMAFEEISYPDYELWICGDGNMSKIIRLKAQKDKRIKYLGLIPRMQVLEFQQKALVLVNPRNPEGEYTKYSFPSKTMEYLLSGTPCIMYPLPGLPKEYEQYIFLVKESGINALKNKIIEVCEMDGKTLSEIGLRAQTFVTQEKNYITQTKRMIEILGIFC